MKATHYWIRIKETNWAELWLFGNEVKCKTLVTF